MAQKGHWIERERTQEGTHEYPSVEDSWVELEMRWRDLPRFIGACGHRVIVNIERPEIVDRTREGSPVKRWQIWEGPPRKPQCPLQTETWRSRFQPKRRPR